MSSRNDDDDSNHHCGGAIVSCDFCGRTVPIMNLQIHQAHACSVTREIVDLYSGGMGGGGGGGGSNNHAVAAAPASQYSDADDDDDFAFWTLDESTTNMAAHAVSSSEEGEDHKLPARAEQQTVIDLYDINDYDVDIEDDADCVVVDGQKEQGRQQVVSPSESPDSDQWTCPNCTLENSQWLDRCEACELDRPSGNDSRGMHSTVRAPDPIQRERLVHDEEDDDYASLFGFDLQPPHSRNHSSRAFGAMSPVAAPDEVSSAAHDDTLFAAPAAQRAPFASSSNYLSPDEFPLPLPTLGRNRSRGNRNNRRRPAASSAVSSAPNASPPARPRQRRRRPSDSDDGGHDDSDDFAVALMHEMMEDALGRMRLELGSLHGLGVHHRQAQPNIDNMTYEQLLSTFGDGSDEMGGSEADIQNLPVVQLKNPKAELPADCRSCNICLEDFETGDLRKTLPCLHGFHAKCADTWLRSNGCCPVCKNKIRDA